MNIIYFLAIFVFCLIIFIYVKFVYYQPDKKMVLFSIANCHACTIMQPIWNNLKYQSEMSLEQVYITNENVANYNISTFPTIHAIQNNIVVAKLVGADEEKLLNFYQAFLIMK